MFTLALLALAALRWLDLPPTTLVAASPLLVGGALLAGWASGVA